jgi:peptidoglycan/xylan/chitin deacetylase (PgdA/CDA1 family)
MALRDYYTIQRTRAAAGLPPGEVILTFDDGPNPENDVTRHLLAVLERQGVCAAFCVIGRHVVQAPDLTRRVHDAGHLLVNHTYTHPLPPLHGPGRLRRELARCDAALAYALKRPAYRSMAFRPPNGIFTTALHRVLDERALVTVPITHYTPDTLLDAATCRTAIDDICADARAQQGGIYVLHERRRPWWGAYAPGLPLRAGTDRRWVPDAVDEIITALRADGLVFADPHGHFAR